ncbi:MAG: uridine kinase [Bryobacteraceae bacterium]
MIEPLVIGIAGPSGAGKTYLAKRLAETEPGAFAFLALDSYYFPLDHLSEGDRAAVNFDHPSAIDWELAAAHVGALKSGEAVEQPAYRFEVHTRAAEGVRVEPRKYVLVEGILALHEERVRRLMDLKVYVESVDNECYRRRMERDCRERGRTPESVERQYRETVRPMAEAYVWPSRAWADIVVTGTEPVQAAVARITSAIAGY